MTGEIVLNQRGIEICRDLVKQGCFSRENARRIAAIMKELGWETVEDVLVILFAKDAFNQEKKPKD
jgi:tyrosine-protein phosphatase YwqE